MGEARVELGVLFGKSKRIVHWAPGTERVPGWPIEKLSATPNYLNTGADKLQRFRKSTVNTAVARDKPRTRPEGPRHLISGWRVPITRRDHQLTGLDTSI